MDTSPTDTNTAREAPRASPETVTGTILDVIRHLLPATRERDQVLEIVGRVLANNELLQRQLAKLLLHAKKNEGVSTYQLRLALGALGVGGVDGASGDNQGIQSVELSAADQKLREASEIDKAKKANETIKPPQQPNRRTPPPEHLPRVDNLIPVPEAERPCPICGVERSCIGHDVTQTIDIEPARAIVRVDRREKLACLPCDGQIVCAPRGDKIVEGGMYGLRLVAHLLVSKFADGLPAHRQHEQLARLGLDLSVSTLVDQLRWATDLLRPIWRAALDEVLASRVMHIDGTGLPVLDPNLKGKTRLGTLWGYVGVCEHGSTAAYLYCSTGKKLAQRPGELGPQDVLARRIGYVVADAAGIFDESFERPDLIECCCNMHSRRYFTKALDAGDQRAALPLAAYKKIYKTEQEIREHDPPLTHEQIRAVRIEKSKTAFDELVAWCRAHQPSVLPSSKLGAAIRYMLNHHVALGRFLTDGVIPIDNGPAERLHVRCAIARKNFLFAGSDDGGERAAIAFTILGSCRLLGIDPLVYLADVLPILSRDIRMADMPALLPVRWKARRDAAKSA